jgi:hypothetical protein
MYCTTYNRYPCTQQWLTLAWVAAAFLHMAKVFRGKRQGHMLISRRWPTTTASCPVLNQHTVGRGFTSLLRRFEVDTPFQISCATFVPSNVTIPRFSLHHSHSLCVPHPMSATVPQMVPPGHPLKSLRELPWFSNHHSIDRRLVLFRSGGIQAPHDSGP